MQMKINEQKKNIRRRRKDKLIKIKQQNDLHSPQSEEKSSTTKVLSKDTVKLKTLHMFEPWIKRDELDVR